MMASQQAVCCVQLNPACSEAWERLSSRDVLAFG
jgi:hypothetical protein